MVSVDWTATGTPLQLTPLLRPKPNPYCSAAYKSISASTYTYVGAHMLQNNELFENSQSEQSARFKKWEGRDGKIFDAGRSWVPRSAISGSVFRLGTSKHMNTQPQSCHAQAV